MLNTSISALFLTSIKRHFWQDSILRIRFLSLVLLSLLIKFLVFRRKDSE